jgi:hypothetical protein
MQPVRRYRHRRLYICNIISLSNATKFNDAEFGCQRCRFVLNAPLTTPCGHNFCKSCLEAAFGGEEIRDRAAGIRSLRVKKVVKICPACKADITDFMSNPQVQCTDVLTISLSSLGGL